MPRTKNVSMVIFAILMGCGVPMDLTKGMDTGPAGTFSDGSANIGCEAMAKWMVTCGDELVDGTQVVEDCQTEIFELESRCEETVVDAYSSGLASSYQCLLDYQYCGTEADIIENPDALSECVGLLDSVLAEYPECFQNSNQDPAVDLGGAEPQEIEYLPINGLRNRLVLGDDDFSVIDIPFEVSFFDQQYTQLTLTSNGVLFVGNVASDGCCAGLAIPQLDEYNGLIALGWGDLVPSTENGVSWQVFGEAPNRELWVQYDAVTAIGHPEEFVSAHLRWPEASTTVDIFVDRIVYSESMTIGVESQDGAWASVFEVHNAKPIELEKTGFRFLIKDGE